VSEHDEVWIYFAGRGAAAGSSAAWQYLAVYDTQQSDLAATAVSSAQIDEWLQLLAAKRILIFLDCGFNSNGEGRTLALSDAAVKHGETFLSTLAGDQRRFLIVAALPSQACLEDEPFEHGLFSYLLLRKLLSELITHERPALTFDELYQHLAVETPQRAEFFGAVQNPLRLGGAGDFLLLTPPAAGATPAETSPESLPEQIKVLLTLAQQEARVDHLEKARELLQGILQLNPENQQAQRGLKIIESEVERGKREQKIKDLFTAGRRFVDDHNYRAALETYRQIQQLDPTSKSAALGLASCEALLTKDLPGKPPQQEPLAVEFVRRTKPYDRFIWPYVGWWALLVCCWKLFGNSADPETASSSFIQPVIIYSFIGAVIGLAHGSLHYAVIKMVRSIRRRRLLRKA
jgi:tetratricopeptide (TPR) repeat protein